MHISPRNTRWKYVKNRLNATNVTYMNANGCENMWKTDEMHINPSNSQGKYVKNTLNVPNLICFNRNGCDNMWKTD